MLRTLLVAALLGAAATACSSGGAAPPSGHVASAGKVTAITGHVTATAPGGSARDLRVNDDVASDDTVVTAADARVTIALAHNHQDAKLEGGQTTLLAQTPSWALPASTGGPVPDDPKAQGVATAARSMERDTAHDTSEVAGGPRAATTPTPTHMVSDNARQPAADQRPTPPMEDPKPVADVRSAPKPARIVTKAPDIQPGNTLAAIGQGSGGGGGTGEGHAADNEHKESGGKKAARELDPGLVKAVAHCFASATGSLVLFVADDGTVVVTHAGARASAEETTCVAAEVATRKLEAGGYRGSF